MNLKPLHSVWLFHGGIWKTELPKTGKYFSRVEVVCSIPPVYQGGILVHKTQEGKICSKACKGKWLWIFVGALKQSKQANHSSDQKCALSNTISFFLGLMGRAIPPDRHSPLNLKEPHHNRGSITQGSWGVGGGACSTYQYLISKLFQQVLIQ